MTVQNEPILGYSGLDLSDECYGYHENACFVADTKASAHEFMRQAAMGEYRIEPVTLSRIMEDYGCSFGEFAMEKEAFARFRAAAKEAKIQFKSAPVDFCPDLTLVNVERVKPHDE
jgi:hypothetical protein